MKALKLIRQEKESSKNIFLPLPLEGLVRLDQVLAHYPVGKTTLYKEIAEGRFPSPIKRGRSTFWDAVQVRIFLKNIGATIQVDK